MKFIEVRDSERKTIICINIDHLICFAKQDEETTSIMVHGFNGALIIDYKYYDFKDAIIFLNKNKDTII